MKMNHLTFSLVVYLYFTAIWAFSLAYKPCRVPAPGETYGYAAPSTLMLMLCAVALLGYISGRKDGGRQ